MKEDSNAGFYDTDSEVYDEKRWKSRSGDFNNATQQRIVGELTQSWTSSRILEVGPGTARFTIPLARKNNRITLVDISDRMLEVARAKLVEERLEQSIEREICGSIYELPFPDEEFDFALSLNVFSHLERAEVAIGEIARVLKPGGELLINYPNLYSYYWPYARRIVNRSRAVSEDVYSMWWRTGTIEQGISASKLAVVARRGHVHVPKAMEKFRVLGLVKVMDRVSRRAPLRALAPVQYRLCRK